MARARCGCATAYTWLRGTPTLFYWLPLSLCVCFRCCWRIPPCHTSVSRHLFTHSYTPRRPLLYPISSIVHMHGTVRCGSHLILMCPSDRQTQTADPERRRDFFVVVFCFAARHSGGAHYPPPRSLHRTLSDTPSHAYTPPLTIPGLFWFFDVIHFSSSSPACWGRFMCTSKGVWGRANFGASVFLQRCRGAPTLPPSREGGSLRIFGLFSL